MACATRFNILALSLFHVLSWGVGYSRGAGKFPLVTTYNLHKQNCKYFKATVKATAFSLLLSFFYAFSALSCDNLVLDEIGLLLPHMFTFSKKFLREGRNSPL